VPHHDHVIVVIMENHSYDEVRVLPYTASLLTQGATLANSYAVTHPSQPNYIALWAGDPLGVTTDACPAPGTPLMAENFGHACETAGLGWRAYCENLAIVGSPSCSYNGSASSGLYVRKHAPWTNFGNLDQTRARPYTDLATDIAAGQLPPLAFVIPNNCHNSHNSSTPGCGIADADAWLGANLPAMIQAAGPRGLVVLTWDEDDSGSANHVLTAFAGGLVQPGAVSNRRVTHYTVVRTICDALGLAPFGQAVSESPIDDVWLQPTSANGHSWGALKTHYR
jgi:acid phosphatase